MSREAVLREVLGATRRRAGADEPALPEGPVPTLAIDDVVARFVMEAFAVQAEVIDAAGGSWWSAVRDRVTDGSAVFVGPGVDVDGVPVPVVDEAAARERPEVVLGVARAAYGLADTGSLVIDHDGAAAPSLLTDTSVVLLRRDRILVGLGALPPPGDLVRSRVLVTGPSRTSDIEKRLVLGAHGPRRLLVVLD